jgi:hypothetical protein
MRNNYNIINEYNINYHHVTYNHYYNNLTTMVRNTMNQIYNNSEEFIQEQEHLREVQEYENELRRQQELRIEELLRQQRERTNSYINEFASITQINDIESLTQEIIELEDEEFYDEMINTYLQDGEKYIETCSICLDDATDVETTSKLSCEHHFHTNCVRLCLERSRKCPLCRQVCLKNE